MLPKMICMVINGDLSWVLSRERDMFDLIVTFQTNDKANKVVTLNIGKGIGYHHLNGILFCADGSCSVCCRMANTGMDTGNKFNVSNSCYEALKKQISLKKFKNFAIEYELN